MRISGVLILCMVVSGANAEVAIESHPVLQVLRRNDARFDNVEIEYYRIENHEIRPERFGFWKSGDDPSRMPDAYWKPRTLKWTRSCCLVVRGSDVILSSQFEPSMSEKDEFVSPGAYYKEGNIGGVRYELSDMQLAADDPGKDLPNYEKQLRITRMNSAMGGLHDTRFAVEFAHGIGFGKRIKSITAISRHEDGFRLTGQIQVWIRDVSTFAIEVDSDYLVREAVIDANVEGNLTRFEVSTKGTVRNGELLLAQKGSFRRTWQPTREQAKSIEPKVQQDFQVVFKGARPDLSDEQFAKLSEFRIAPLMQVDDFVNDVRGTGAKREDGTVFVRERPRVCGEHRREDQQSPTTK